MYRPNDIIATFILRAMLSFVAREFQYPPNNDTGRYKIQESQMTAMPE